MATINITLNQEEMQHLLLKDSSGAFRELLERTVNAFIQAESDEQLGAERYAHNVETRTDFRNGNRFDSLVLDAGYVSKELIHTFHNGTEKTIIGRMPARRGYPYKTLYWEFKNLIGKGKYAFVRNRHAYFGIRKTIQLFEQPIYAYVYVDQNNATKRFTDYLCEHEEDYVELKAKGKDWMTVKYGSSIMSPKM